MKKRNQNINNNKKKEKPSYAKMYKEQIKKESEINSNKSNMANSNKNEPINDKPQSNHIEKQEIKHNAGINFDNLSDWDNIVYPEEKEIKQILNNNQNNNIQPVQQKNENYNNNNNNNNLNSGQLPLNRMDFQNDNNTNNNIINQIQEEENDYDSDKEQLEQIHQNLNSNIINYNLKTNEGVIQNQNNNNEFSLKASEFTNNNSNQIKPIDFKLGSLNDPNNVIKEEDSLEQEENNNNINIKNDNNDIDNLKDQRDIMEQMEEEMNISMNQMNELAGNLQGNNNKSNNKNKKTTKQIQGNKNKKIYLKNNNSSQGNINQNIQNNKNNINSNINNINNNINAKFNGNIYDNINANVNNEIPLNNNISNNNPNNNYFNPNNFSFKPTNIQQVSSEEVNKFIQNSQQKIIESSEQKNNNEMLMPNNQQQINNNINQDNNINIQNQMNMNPLYPSPYPMVVGPNNNYPPPMYNMPFNINQPILQGQNIYPYPAQNFNYQQFPVNPMLQNKQEQKIEKKKVNYKPKSLKEYKEKYNNGIKEHRGGLGANIGGEEWEHKKEQNMKVKKYSEMVKNQNKEKENNFKKKINNVKIKNELNDQLYDSLSDEVLEDSPKEKKQKISENDKEKEKRPESNKVKYLMQLKKDKEKEKEKESKSKEKNSKQKGKYSRYTKIVIESIDKGTNPNEKKLGKIYTTFKPKQPQRRPSTKDKNKLLKPIVNNNQKRSQSTAYKNHAYTKNEYDDELTKQFMSPNPNNYNGFSKNKDDNNNFMLSPTVEIENLIHKKNQYDDKVKEIKKFLKQ